MFKRLHYARLRFGQLLFAGVEQTNEASQLWFDESASLCRRRHSGRQRSFNDFAERTGVVVRDPARKFEDFRTAHRLQIDKTLSVFNVYLCKIGGKLAG